MCPPMLRLTSLVVLATSSAAAVRCADQESGEDVSMLTVGRGRLSSPCDKGHFAVTKKVVSSKVRFVFFAGVENTGHHVWSDMLSRLPVHFSQSLQDALDSKDGRIKPQGGHGGVFGSSSSVDREDSAKTVVQIMSHMASNLSSTPGCKVVPLNLVTNMISYPNGGGPDRVFQNPDLLALAKLAESAGVDLRIVLLVRHPAYMIPSRARTDASNIFHDIQIITMTLALLSAQLNLLDPEMVGCWSYDDPTTITRLPELLSFMGFCGEDLDLGRRSMEEVFKPSNRPPASKAEQEMLETSTQVHQYLVAKWCG